MQDNTSSKKHCITLTSREQLALSGVNDVSGFDEETVSVETVCGTLIIKGAGLHISKLSLETGEVDIDGNISSMQYLGTTAKKSLMSRIFK